MLSWIMSSRLVFCPALALTFGVANANTITTFDILGTAAVAGNFITGSTFVSGVHEFSGKLTMDVIAGEVTVVDISVPIMGPDFTNLLSSSSDCSLTCGWEITATNGSSFVSFAFSTTVPGSLVGFNGGSIMTGQGIGGSGGFLFVPQTGDLTPVGETPLPATLPLFATGLGVLGLLGWRRRQKAAP
jgi:hypothetical protein